MCETEPPGHACGSFRVLQHKLEGKQFSFLRAEGGGEISATWALSDVDIHSICLKSGLI
jgi:hypothetical protein